MKYTLKKEHNGSMKSFSNLIFEKDYEEEEILKKYYIESNKIDVIEDKRYCEKHNKNKSSLTLTSADGKIYDEKSKSWL